nr:HAD family hydrolase [Beijerinckia indica]
MNDLPADDGFRTAFLFDLDGTLVDSVYQHVLAWKTALEAEQIPLSVWRIHRRIGMSGGLFMDQLLREVKRDLGPDAVERLQAAHAAAYHDLGASVRPLPGAREIIAALDELGVRWAIATSGRLETASINLATLGVDPKSAIVVTRDQVRYAKPDPDLFVEAARRLQIPIQQTIVVGYSVWDMLAATRCRALGVGFLSGGYGSEELERAGALRVYDDPADLLFHLDEICSRHR